jgi:phosphoserine phosphatase
MNQAKEYYKQFFNQQITYKQWAQLDAALWKNQPYPKIQQIIGQMPYTKNAKETLHILRQQGIKTYLLSAGLTQVAQSIQNEVGTDGYAANTLVVKDGYLTGEVDVNVSFYDKDKHLPGILRKFNVNARECAAVGDDPTLIPLFRKVAFAIAFRPLNKAIAQAAHVTVKSSDFQAILPFLLNNAKT